MNDRQSQRENMMNVLMYIFENYMHSDCDIQISREKLIAELYQVGFQYVSINKALNWIASLVGQQKDYPINISDSKSIRVFSIEECKKIDLQCRNKIMQMERIGILNSTTRELVISQIMQLDHLAVNVGQVKWVALMVLLNQPDQRYAISCLENLVLTDTQGNLQ